MKWFLSGKSSNLMVVERLMTTRDGLYLQRGRGSIYKSSSSTAPIGPYITYGLSRGRILAGEKQNYALTNFQLLHQLCKRAGEERSKAFPGAKPIKFLPFRDAPMHWPVVQDWLSKDWKLLKGKDAHACQSWKLMTNIPPGLTRSEYAKKGQCQ